MTQHVATFAARVAFFVFAAAPRRKRVHRLRLIDTHHHILPPFYVQALGVDAIAAGLGGVPAWSPETSLAAMDRYGIDTAVASISNPGIAVKDRKKAAALAR